MMIYVENEDHNEAKYGVDHLHLQEVIEVQPTDTLSSLISTIQQVFSILDEEIGDRILLHRSRPRSRDLLSDEDGSSTLGRCGIEAYACLVVGFKVPFSAQVLTSDRRRVHLEMVSPFDTFAEIKERAAEPKRLGASDDKTLLSMGIFVSRRSEMTFYINVSPPSWREEQKFWIWVSIPYLNRRFSHECKPTDTIDKVREAIRNRCDDPTDELLYHLKPVMQGNFVLFKNNKTLKDCSTIDECDLRHASGVCLLGTTPVPISVSVTETAACFDLHVKCFYSIGKLKKMLSRLTGIPPSRQNLMYREKSLDAAERPLVAFGIEPPFEYDVESKCRKNHRSQKKFCIRLDTLESSIDRTRTSSVTEVGSPQSDYSRPNRKRRLVASDDTPLQVVVEIPTIPICFAHMFKPADTVGDVRMVIQRKIKKGLFVLFSDRKQLKDDSITLHECGIKNMDYIQVLEEDSFEIAISAPEKGVDTIRVRVACFDTVGRLKEKLRVRTCILPELQRLVYHNWFLDDDNRLLVDYGIATYSLVLQNHPEKHHPCFGNHKREEFLILLFASSVDPESGRSIAATNKAGISSHEFMKLSLYGSPDNPRPCSLFASEMAFEDALAALSIPTLPSEDSSTLLIQIAIETPNMAWRFPLVCKPTNTVGNVRQAIRRECYKGYEELLGNKYIKEGWFVLTFDRKQLLNESLTLHECGIRHMNSIQLLEDEYIPIEITVVEKVLYTRIHMKCFDTIRKLMDDICKMTGIPPSQQHMMMSDDFYGWRLEDDDEGSRRLVDYGITRVVRYDKDTGNHWPDKIFELSVRSSGCVRSLSTMS